MGYEGSGPGALARRLGAATALLLTLRPEHTVKTRLARQVDAPIGQARHDLRRRQALVLRGIAHVHNRLALLVAQGVGAVFGSPLPGVL